MLISKLPEILVVHLKRFKLEPKKVKLTNKIKFPLNSFNPKRYFFKLFIF